MPNNFLATLFNVRDVREIVPFTTILCANVSERSVIDTDLLRFSLDRRDSAVKMNLGSALFHE